MTHRWIELTEYQTERVYLTSEQVSELRLCAKGIQVIATDEGANIFDVTPDSSVGVVNLSDLQILINPKIPIERVMFLIAYSMDPVRWQDTGFNYDPDRSLLESIIPGFIWQVSRAISPGLLHSYQSIEDSLPVLKGRLRVGEQVKRHYGIMFPLEVQFDEYTEDVLENRIIKAAIHSLKRIRLRSSESRKSLSTFDRQLESVSLHNYYGAHIPDVHFTRLNERYRSAIALAKLILQFTSLELRPGGVQSASFLVDMNVVFENFVRTALREALHLSEYAMPDVPRTLYLDSDRQVKIKPDLQWWNGGRCVFLGDAKYKRTTAKGGHNPDIYQVLSYMIAMNLDRSTLIYARGEMEEQTYDIPHIGGKIHVRNLNLELPPDQLLEEVSELSENIVSGRLSAKTLIGVN